MRARLELAIAGAQLGIWSYDPRTGSCWFSDRCKELLGARRQFHRPTRATCRRTSIPTTGRSSPRLITGGYPRRAARDRVPGRCRTAARAGSTRSAPQRATRAGSRPRSTASISTSPSASAQRGAGGDPAAARAGGRGRQARHLDGRPGHRRGLVFGPLARDVRARPDASLDARTLKAYDPSRRLGPGGRALSRMGFPDDADRARASRGLADGEMRWVLFARHRAARRERRGAHGQRHPSRHHRPQAGRGGAGALARRAASSRRSSPRWARCSPASATSSTTRSPRSSARPRCCRRTRAAPTFEERARKIGAAAERCARIVQTFLAMARQREPQRGPGRHERADRLRARDHRICAAHRRDRGPGRSSAPACRRSRATATSSTRCWST